jgi:uncharacterized protein YjbI with pentapeptide repeats
MNEATYNKSNFDSIEWEENHFKYCDFSNFSHEGGVVDSDFNLCSFSGIDWYWGIFTQANFIECKFSNCTFRGSSFTDSRFIECTFDNCKFIKDNVGGECTFENSTAYNCSTNECSGFLALSK